MIEKTEHENEHLGSDPKGRFEALAILERQQWREYDIKVRHEWRLSFAIWTALLAASGAIFGGRLQFGESHLLIKSLPTIFAILVSGFAILYHHKFLYWTQTRIQEIRNSLWEIRTKMESIAETTLQEKQFSRDPKKQPSLDVQIGITIILCFVLITVAAFCILS